MTIECGYNVVFQFTDAAGPLSGSMEWMNFGTKEEFREWYEPLKVALLNEVYAEGISGAEAEKLATENKPVLIPLEERIRLAQENVPEGAKPPADSFKLSQLSISGKKDGLSPVGVVPLHLRGLVLLAIEMEETFSTEQHRRCVEEFGKLEYDKEGPEFQIYCEIEKDPFFAGLHIVMKYFAEALEVEFPAIAANEKRGRMFHIGEDWLVYTAPEIPYRDEEHRRQIQTAAKRLRELLK